MLYNDLDALMRRVQQRDPHQAEFQQAVAEVMASIWPFIEGNTRYRDAALLDTLIEPDRVIQFRVNWQADDGSMQVNRAWRVQHSAAVGPYKGGMRFHPSVNLSVLKFLAFEQTFKNALTMLALGGAKGGADFDPKGRSDHEIRRFCEALMVQLHRHLGPDTDVPAGDIGVGAREVGYFSGAWKRLTNNAAAPFTGKGLAFGGSHIRPESTGYGLIYFVEHMLQRRSLSLEGLRVLVSGAGNVAQYAIAKALSLGATVLTVSDSQGTMVDPEGFDAAKFEQFMQLCSQRQGGVVQAYARLRGLDFLPGKRPWNVPADVALPCATQNELNADDARRLVANGVMCVAEGANMPSTPEAIEVFREAGVLFGPGKASNAGGVATSGLEMSQNAARLAWTREEVDQRLRAIMQGIHDSCVHYGTRHGKVDYVDGANVAGFVRVADALIAQGYC